MSRDGAFTSVTEGWTQVDIDQGMEDGESLDGYKALVPLNKHFCPEEYEVCKKMQLKTMQLSESTMKFVNEIQKLAKQ